MQYCIFVVVSLVCALFRIISQLENLKKEAAEVQHKVEETDTIMAEVEMVSQQYLPLSTACSSMYFTLESLNQVSPPSPAIYIVTYIMTLVFFSSCLCRFTSCTSFLFSSSLISLKVF